MSRLNSEQLKKLGREIQEKLRERFRQPDSIVKHVDDVIKRKEFGRSAMLGRVLHFVVTAERDFHYVNLYGLLEVLRSFLHLERGEKIFDSAKRPEKDIPEALRRALERSCRPEADFHRLVLVKLGNEHYTLKIYPEDQVADKPSDVRTRVSRAEDPASEELTRAFWAAYLTEGGLTEIVYGLPLFTRRGEGEEREYTRRIKVNKAAEAREKFKEEEISWAFVTLGDVLCMHRLMGWLQLRGAALDTHGYDYTADFEEFKRNVKRAAQVVIIGSPRVCGLISVYQGVVERDPPGRRLPFQIGLDSIVKYDDQKAIRTFTEKDRADGLVESPVVVTRRPGALEGVVTMITGNHGRAVERVGEILTDEKQFSELLQDEALKDMARRMPECFQLVLSVRVHARIRLEDKPSVLDVWWE